MASYRAREGISFPLAMASPQCGLSWKATSCSATATSGCFSIRIRRRRVSSSLQDSSSSSSHSCRAASVSTSKPGHALSKDVKLAAPVPKSIRINEIEADGASVPKATRTRGGTSPNLRSLFERRSLWRRIWFASKKVRSIILLNVVTVVYGKFLVSCCCFEDCSFLQ